MHNRLINRYLLFHRTQVTKYNHHITQMRRILCTIITFIISHVTRLISHTVPKQIISRRNNNRRSRHVQVFSTRHIRRVSMPNPPVHNFLTIVIIHRRVTKVHVILARHSRSSVQHMLHRVPEKHTTRLHIMSKFIPSTFRTSMIQHIRPTSTIRRNHTTLQSRIHLHTRVTYNSNNMQVPDITMQTRVRLQVNLSRMTNHFTTLTTHCKVTMRFSTTLQRQHHHQRRLHSLIRRGTVRIGAVITLILPFGSHRFVFSIQRVNNSYRISQVTQSIILLSNQFRTT